MNAFDLLPIATVQAGAVSLHVALAPTDDPHRWTLCLDGKPTRVQRSGHPGTVRYLVAEDLVRRYQGRVVPLCSAAREACALLAPRVGAVEDF